MKNTDKIYSVLALIFIIGIFTMVFLSTRTEEVETKPVGGNFASTRSVTFFNATTTSATSTTAQASSRIGDAKSVTFFFKRGGLVSPNVGTSTYSVQVSEDDSTWITYNKLVDNVTNSNSQQLTRVSSIVLSAASNVNTGTSTKAYVMDLTTDSYKFLRCIVVEEADGEHTCKALIKY